MSLASLCKETTTYNTEKEWDAYVIMHGDTEVAMIKRGGMCKIMNSQLMPYSLYFEECEEGDIDLRIQNLDNFYFWCSSRVLSLDRQYAKIILNSIGASQGTTDRERARIALSYHCLSLMDIYWVKEIKEKETFHLLNLFENHLDQSFIDVTLRGKSMTITNSHLIADDLGTQGCFPKAWIREKDRLYLMKDGGATFVERELVASQICRCFDVNQVLYEEDYFDGKKVSKSEIVTSLSYSIVSVEQFMIYAANQEIDGLKFIRKLDGYSYDMMNILDYLIGNVDRHWGNWGLLIDNTTNRPMRIHNLMDFNQAFQSYDTIEGAPCLTTKERKTQKQAAIEAVKRIGFHPIRKIPEDIFSSHEEKVMFQRRFSLLQNNLKL